jgi:hypothetical protein
MIGANKKARRGFSGLFFLEPRFFAHLIGVVKLLIRFGQIDDSFYQTYDPCS